MNELQQRRLQKQYESYYATYNKGIRQMQESIPTRTTKGTVSWNECNEVHTIKLVKGVN